MEDLVEKTDSTSETAQEETIVDAPADTKVEPEQDPLKVELERVQKKSAKSEVEKARDNLFFNAKRAKELGIDPAEVLGFKPKEDESIEDEDDKPLTRGEWKRMQQESASKTAVQLAQEIPNETERELATWHLENTIKSTGNPSEDLKLAMNQVNAVKNSQILEEIQRKGPAKTHSTASSAPAKYEVDEQLTDEEIQFMKFGNLSKEEVIAARK